MAKDKTKNGSIQMTEDKQVTKPAKKFWFPDGPSIEATTAHEAGEKFNSKS